MLKNLIILAAIFSFSPNFALAQAQEPCQGTYCRELDELAIDLEAERLIFIITGTRNFSLRATELMLPPVQRGLVTFAQIEQALRRMNTGIHLFAVHKRMLENTPNTRSICVSALPGQPATDYYIFVSAEGPQAAQRHATSLQIASPQENLQNLATVGILTVCTSS